MTEHTPGPWQVDGGFPHCRISASDTATYGGHMVAKVNAGRDEFEANARLIAAAPDLLAALEYYLEGEPGPEYVAYRSPKAVREKARDAIAKAKGQTD